MPTAVFVYDCGKLEVAAVLQHTRPVRLLLWDPNSPRLLICTGGSRVHLWTADGASVVSLPLPRFRCTAVAWSPDSAALLLSNRDSFCTAYLS